MCGYSCGSGRELKVARASRTTGIQESWYILRTLTIRLSAVGDHSSPAAHGEATALWPTRVLHDPLPSSRLWKTSAHRKGLKPLC